MAKRKRTSRHPLGYHRFATAAEAIRFAVEEFPAAHALGALMQVGDERFDGDDINVFTREMITHCDGVCQIDHTTSMDMTTKPRLNILQTSKFFIVS
jgi:hypothetical protein